MKKKKKLQMPTTEELEQELQRLQYKNRYRSALKSTVYTLITVAAAVVLVATLWLPVLQIYGSSMTPTLQPKDIVVTLKRSEVKHGDIIAFYYNNKILIKRVIATPGQWVDIDEAGQVFIDGHPLQEPYIQEPAFGDTNIKLPYQVPDGKIFVMGDHRETSLDSRNTAVGTVSQEQLVGKILLRIWPFDRAGEIS